MIKSKQEILLEYCNSHPVKTAGLLQHLTRFSSKDEMEHFNIENVLTQIMKSEWEPVDAKDLNK